MGEVVTMGLDIAKSVFQVRGDDAEGQVVVQRRLTRAKLISFFRTNRSNTWPHRSDLTELQDHPCQRGAVHTWR